MRPRNFLVRFTAPMFVALVALTARADILHLKDGSRHYGKLISQDSREIVFEVALSDGQSAVVTHFPAATVERVEKTPRIAPPIAADRAPAGDAVKPADDFDQMLREAFELLDDGDAPAATRALTRIVRAAPSQALRQLEERTKAARGVRLVDLLAKLRCEDAIRTGRGRAFRLRGVTAYEADVLAVLLAGRERELLDRQHNGQTIERWAADPSSYKELDPGAPQMVANATLTAGMIGERLRFDPALANEFAERQRLAQLRDRLLRFAAHVSSMRGFTALGPAGQQDDAAGEDELEGTGSPTASQPATQRQTTTRPARRKMPKSLFEDDNP